MKFTKKTREMTSSASGQKRFCRGCGNQLFASRWGYQEVCSKPRCQQILLARAGRCRA